MQHMRIDVQFQLEINFVDFYNNRHYSNKYIPVFLFFNSLTLFHSLLQGRYIELFDSLNSLNSRRNHRKLKIQKSS